MGWGGVAYVKVECSVPRHPKFLKAGPAPAWLWLCGLTYCQDGLTDGFIPDMAIDSLGITKNARRLAEHLVTAGLWEKVDGGWRVHDYLEHNKPAISVREIKDRRKAFGQLGGVASGFARRSTDAKQSASPSSKQNGSSKNLERLQPTCEPTCTDASASEVVAVAGMDSAFARFQARYPPSRVKGGYMVEQLFIQAYQQLGEKLFAVLENHRASEQWQKPALIPGMDRWFKEELWRQEMPAAKGKWDDWKPREVS